MLEHVHGMLWTKMNSNMSTIKMGSNLSRYLKLIEVGVSIFFFFSFFEVGEWNEFEFALTRDWSFTMELFK